MLRYSKRLFSIDYFVKHHNFSNIVQGKSSFDKDFNSELVDKVFSKQFDISQDSLAYKYIHQVLACILNPDFKTDQFPQIYKEAKEKADYYTKQKKFIVGAYSDAQGWEFVRETVSDYVARRDGIDSLKAKHIILSNGANNAYKVLIHTLFSRGDSILIPSPCHPLNRFRNSYAEVQSLPYKLTYDTWEIDMNHLHEVLHNARKQGNKPKGILVYNPHFPTGKVMTYGEIEEVVKFCFHNRLFIISNETFQMSTYEDSFVSFRKVVSSMPYPYNQTEVLSIFSISNSNFILNQSIKGGFVDALNVDDSAFAQIYKSKTIDLSSNSPSQLFIDLKLTDFEKEMFDDDFKENYRQSLNNLKEFNKKAVEIFHYILQSTGYVAHKPQAGVTFFGRKSEKKILTDNNFVKMPGTLFGADPELANYELINMKSII